MTLTIDTTPVAQGRPRVVRLPNGRSVAYDPRKSKEYKAYVRLAAQAAGFRPLNGPVRLTVVCGFAVPQSMSKKRRAAALLNQWRDKKPDLTNLIKAVEDALDGVAWHDDSQVAQIAASKIYGADGSYIEITVEMLYTEGEKHE